MKNDLSFSSLNSENQRNGLTVLLCDDALLAAKQRSYREVARYICRPPGLLFC